MKTSAFLSSLRRRRVIYFSVLLSFVLHLWLFASPDLRSLVSGFKDGTVEDEPMVAAKIEEVGGAPVAAAVVPSAQPATPVAAQSPPPDREVVNASTEDATPAPEAAAGVAAPDREQAPESSGQPSPQTVDARANAPASVPSAAPAQPKLHLPPHLTLEYRLFRGDDGMTIGRGVQRWQASDGQYLISSEAEASGLLAILNLGAFTQVSRGRITADGLQPESYREQRGKNADRTFVAQFDYQNHVLSVGRIDDIKTVELVPGTQDQISFIYQFALRPPSVGTVRVPLATGRKFDHYEVVVVGEERLETGLGELNTLHLSRQKREAKDEGVDIWLAKDHRYLPVKVLFTDRKGDKYGQVVTAIRSE